MSKASNKSQWIIGTVLLIGAFGIAIVGMAVADFGENEDRVLVGASANSEAQYTSECGACHIAYLAGFLPERSWKNIMGSLDNHFGENAELDTDTGTIITGYLVANAGENSTNRKARKFMRNIVATDVPLRITGLSYFKRKHDEVPVRYVKDNPDVGSFSQCQACHGDKAASGIFNEHTVNIPNYGRWDD